MSGLALTRFNSLVFATSAFLLIGCGGSNSSNNKATCSAGMPIETVNQGNATQPKIAIANNGSALAVWTQKENDELLSGRKIWANRYIKESGWESATAIEQNGGLSRAPSLVMDNNGNATAVWINFDGGFYTNNYANHYLTGEGWQTAGLIKGSDQENFSNSSGTNLETPIITGDQQGNRIAIWYDAKNINSGPESVWASKYTAGAGWGTATMISNIFESSNYSPAKVHNQHVDTNSHGSAVAVWVQGDKGKIALWASLYSIDSGWGAPNRITATSDTAEINSYFPRIAINDSGNVTLIWLQEGGNKKNILSKRYTPDKGWGDASIIQENIDEAATTPQITKSKNGDIFAIWSQSDGNRYNIWSNHYKNGVGWSTAQLIEESNDGDATDPHIATNHYGNAVVAWSQSDGTKKSIWTNRYFEGSGWEKAQKIDVNSSGDATEPHVALHSNDNAIVVWAQAEEKRTDVWAKCFEYIVED